MYVDLFLTCFKPGRTVWIHALALRVNTVTYILFSVFRIQEKIVVRTIQIAQPVELHFLYIEFLMFKVFALFQVIVDDVSSVIMLNLKFCM